MLTMYKMALYSVTKSLEKEKSEVTAYNPTPVPSVKVI